VLAGTAGLLVRSYGALARVDSGIEPSHVLTFHVGAAWDEDRSRVGQLQERLVAGLAQIPGVRAAGFANFLPETGATLRSQVRVEGLSAPADPAGLTVGTRMVTPGYMKALAIPLVAGAWCEEARADLAVTRVRGALVNRQFVTRFAGGQNVVGRRLGIGSLGAFQIDGIVGDVLEDSPAAPAVPYVYFCTPAGSWPDPEYVARTDGDPRAVAGSVRALVTSLDASRPVFGLRPLGDVMDAALDQPRLSARVMATFAAAALGLAALGLYGLLMLLVTERRRELGVRSALGAAPRDLVRVVALGGGRLVISGLIAGVLLMLVAGRLLQSLLFGVAPYDVTSLAAAVAALTVTALVALAIPARQAARVSAMEAMRTP
jgi:putative ABC transport system permease protein